MTPEITEILNKLRKKVVIGFVGGSDLSKQKEQLGPNGTSVDKQVMNRLAINRREVIKGSDTVLQLSTSLTLHSLRMG